MPERLLALIHERPGPTFTELQTALQIGSGTLTHHLKKLAREGKLHLVRHGCRRLVYPPGIESHAADALLRGQTVRAIATAIHGHPGLDTAQIAQLTGLKPRLAYYHLKRLVAAGLITSESVKRYARLRPTPRLTFALTNLQAAVGSTSEEPASAKENPYLRVPSFSDDLAYVPVPGAGDRIPTGFSHVVQNVPAADRAGIDPIGNVAAMASSLDTTDPTGLTTAHRLAALDQPTTMYANGGAAAINDAPLITKGARDANAQLGDEYTDGFTIAATKPRFDANGQAVAGLDGADAWRNDQRGGVLGNNANGRSGFIQEGVIISRAERGMYSLQGDPHPSLVNLSTELHPGNRVLLRGDIINTDQWTATVNLLIEAQNAHGKFVGRTVETIYNKPAEALAPHERFTFTLNWTAPANVEYGTLSLMAGAKKGESPVDYALALEREREKTEDPARDW